MPDMLRALATTPSVPAVPNMPPLPDDEQVEVRRQIIADMAADDARQPLAALFQDFTVRCRMKGVRPELSPDAFRQRLALARAGIDDAEGWEDALTLGAALPEEMLPPFLSIVRAAREERVCPDDDTLARLYGTSSPGRARRMLAFIEEKGLLVSRTDLAGRRTISIPHLGWTTAPAPTTTEPAVRTRGHSGGAARPDPLAAALTPGLRSGPAGG